MTTIIGGHALGVQDGSLSLLNRNDQTSQGTLGVGVESYVNVSDGNLLIQERDAFLPSRGADFSLVRTYNSRGAIQGSPDGWWWSTGVSLSAHQDTVAGSNGTLTNYAVRYGDGSELHFDFDAGRGLWVSTDGTGAYETLQVIPGNGKVDPKYVITRADQTRYEFDKNFTLERIVDTNGIATEFTYQGGLIQTIRDDTGHTIVYQYSGSKLTSIVDRHAGQADVTLVRYVYSQSLLTQVTDRFGHTTTYTYDNKGLLIKVALPFQQTVNGQLQSFETREIQFTYAQVDWNDHPHLGSAFDTGSQWVVTSITDPLGGLTTFDYNFQFSADALGAGDRDVNYKPVGGRKFQGGSTRVVDAMGNGLANSNGAEFQAKRVALGYAAEVSALTPAQKDALRSMFSMTYAYDPDGYITKVTDQLGLYTTYTYGGMSAGDPQSALNQDNLLSITDRNGVGASTSNSEYFRALRQDLGYVDLAGNGKLVADLTPAEVSEIVARFTTRFTYDSRGNLLTSTDGVGNQASYSYTAFNKVATATAAMGNALASSDETQYQHKRVELGFAALVANLTPANKDALRALYTTTYAYDAKQNLTSRTDPGGDVTQFEYDAFGNLVKRTVVYRDGNGVAVPAKNQVTTYAYDALGNNTSIVDGEGNVTTRTFDHFGNLLTSVDGRGGVTTFTYDADNRLLTQTDPEGHATINAYDAVGNRISVTDAAGHTITQVFDRNNLLIATIDPSAGDPAATRTTTFKYDILGNRTEVTDAEGRKTVYAYDARRQLVDVRTPQVLNAGGTLTAYSTTYAYDGESRIVTVKDNNGNVTQSLYTPNGLLKRVTDAVGNVTEYLYDANLQQVQITVGAQLAAALRRVLKFSYDEENQLIAQIDAMGFVTRTAYDAPGQVVALTDANGNTSHFEYDRNNRLIKETRPLLAGQVAPYTVLHKYDANGNEIETTDENGHTTKFSFDKDDNQVMISDANGIETVFTYDSRHNQTRIAIGVQAHVGTDGRVVIDDASQGQVASFVYDEFNQIVSSTDGVGNALVSSDATVYRQLRLELGFAEFVAGLSAADKTTLLNRFTERFAYDRVGNLVKSVDHLGRITALEYDALNRLQQRTEAQGTALERSSSLRYDGNGNVVKSTDALGRSTLSRYDGVDRLIAATDPLGVTTAIEYDNVGNIVASTEAAGTANARRSQFLYDLNDRLTREMDPGGHELAYEYDAVGNRLKVTDARGAATRYVYDALNRNIRIIDPLSFETRYEYDGVGNRIALTDPRGGITRFVYDPGNRYVETTDAEGRVTRLAYDPLGNVITQTSAFGTPQAEVSSFVYDAEGNLRSATDAKGNVETRGYDDVYNYTRTTDRNGHTTTYGFDALNRQIRVTEPLGGQTLYSYDAADNRLTVADPLGRIRNFEYDVNNRLIRETDPLLVETRYAFDEVGNRVSITRAANTAQAATTRFVYNVDDLLIEQIDALDQVTRFEHDENHNVTRNVDANGHATRYEYDANNQVTRIIDPLGNATTYRYDGNGNRTQVVDGRGYVNTTYFNRNNEVSLSVDAEGYATQFVYDANGNVVSRTLFATALGLPLDPAVEPTPTVSAGDQTVRFEFDKLNRVVRGISAEGYAREFAYDAVGNQIEVRENRDRAGTDVAITRIYFDALDREVARITPERYLATSDYDAVGNRVRTTIFNERVAVPSGGSLPVPVGGDAGRVTSFQYDVNNRLVEETSPLGSVARYGYDLRGNQTSITEAAGAAEQRTTRFSYDLADRLTDTEQPDGTITHLVLDADGNIVERHEAFGTADARVTRFEYDGNHNVVRDVDAEGVATQLRYDAAGNLTEKVLASGTADQRSERFQYDGDNRLTSSVNAKGESTRFEYDAAGNRTRVVQAAGLPEERQNTFEYDLDNRQVAVVDGINSRTEYKVDGQGNRLETRQAVGVVGVEKATRYEYDLENRLVEIVSPKGAVTRYEYDVLGNKVRIVDGNGGVTLRTFDAQGRVISETTPENVLTTLEYDQHGNLLGRTTGNRTTSFKYDAKGRQVEITDGEDFTTRITYDKFDNQIKIERGLYLVAPGSAAFVQAKKDLEFPLVTDYAYDKSKRLVSMTDGEGSVTKYEYDRVGNRTSETVAFGIAGQERRTNYTYDAANQLVRIASPAGGVKEFSYDAVGNAVQSRKLQSGDPNASPSTAVWITETFEYDDDGHQTAAVNGLSIRTERTFDAVGNLLSERVAAGTADVRETRYEYNLDNQLIAEIDPLGHRAEYTRDAMGNRIKVKDALGREAHYYFDGANRLVAILDAEGYVNTFEYDASGNRTESRVFMQKYSGPIDDFTAPVVAASSGDRVVTTDYDNDDNIVRVVKADGQHIEYGNDSTGTMRQRSMFSSNAADAPRVERYGYDLNGRLSYFMDVDGSETRIAYDAANNKTSETITDPSYPLGDTNRTRVTRYEYDLDNRVTREVYDPSGLNISQSLQYDKLGNIVRKADGNGTVTLSVYDLNNRLIEVNVDPSGLAIRTRFEYDAAGNQTRMVDARGNTTNFVYDKNNRLLSEILPAVTVFDVQSGVERVVNPTTQTVYDAVGNVVQTVDANGNRTTQYFNGNDKVVAVLRGDNTLAEFAYNAANELVEERLYMERLPASAHDVGTRPVPVGSNVRVTNREYDLGGRLVRVIHPPTEVATLNFGNAANPTDSRSTYRTQEVIVYNGFGESVEAYDRNAVGNQPATGPLDPSTFSRAREVSYYDAKGRVAASVNAEGFLTEWDYDGQDNVIAQRNYKVALDMSSVSPTTRPGTSGLGTPETFSRRYDALNRLTDEISGELEVLLLDPANLAGSTSTTTRVTTHHTYDAMGNETSRTRAFGTSAAATDYFYRDAIGRLVALVNSDKVLHEYRYDANNNQTLQKRYFDTVSLSDAALRTATLAALLADVTGDAGKDQSTVRDYDAANRLTREADQMNLATAGDDLVMSTRYDAAGNKTRVTDERGSVSMTGYDGVNRVNQLVSPDGSGTLINYDAAGNAVLIYTGNVSNTILPATVSAVRFDNVGTSNEADDAFVLSWTVPATVDVQTYVVYGASQLNVTNPDTAYASRTALGSTMGATEGAVSIASAGLAAGSTVYFRVVSEDRAGNKTWSKEQSFLVPPRFRDVNVSQPSATQMAVRVTFDAGVVNPQLLVTGQAAQAFVAQGGGVYLATVTVAGDPRTLSYQIVWQDSAGGSYSSAVAPFRATDSEIGTYTTLSETVTAGSNVSLKTKIATGKVTGVIAKWRAVGSSTGYTSTGAIAAASSAAGVDTFELNLTPGLAAGGYDVILLGRLADGSEVTLDTFRISAGNGTVDGRTEQSLSWTLPEVGDDPDVGNNQLVVIDGLRVASTRDGGRLLVDSTVAAGSAASYAAFYGSRTGVTHDVAVDQKVVTTSVGTNQNRVDAYQLSVSATNLPAGAKVAWRPAGSGIEFTNLADPATLFTVATSGGLPRQFDVKVYYVDGAGREVMVDWARVTINGPAFGAVLSSPGATTRILTESVESLMVLAQERDGVVSRGANSTDNAFAFSRGLYTGPISDETVVRPLALSPAQTPGAGNVAGSSTANGLSRGYYVENEFNALDAKVATNEGTGVWRRFGIDANGNGVATYVYGTKAAEAAGAQPLVSHTRFNARNYQTGEYGVAVRVDGDANGINETTARAVTTSVRDYLDRVVSETNSLGTTTTTQYNTLGLVTSETTTNGGTLSSKQMKYDVLGNLVKEIDGLNHARYHVYAGTRLVRDVDGLGNATNYQYDSFGRRTQITTPAIRISTSGTTASATVRMSYDQRDRLVDAIDGLGNHTTFAYDGRNNRTSMVDANGHVWGTTYDSLNRVLTRTSTQNSQVITQSRSYDYYGNVISETDEMGRVKSSQFGVFGRKLSEVDEGGRVTTFTYDDFGRLITQRRVASGMNITREYDAANHLVRVADAATGVSTDYTYTVAGDRAHEAVNATGHQRRIAYSYDAMGRMTGWNDTAQGVSMSYEFDLASNLKRARGSNGVDHTYTYDAADRLMQVNDGSTLFASYAYDAAGDRISYTAGGTTYQYQYDLNGRVTKAVSPDATVTWTYDKVGNVTQFDNDGAITNYSYYENNRNYVTDDLGAKSKTTLTLDKSGRIVKTVLVDSSGDDPSTFTFTHTYSADGRELSVSGTGDASGTSTSSYDANDNLIALNLGQGDKQASAETKSFVYNNENQIIYRNHLTGETADSVGSGNTPRKNNSKEFYYANSNPVGDKGNTEESATVVTTLDSGRYLLVQPIGKDYPDTAVSTYRVLAGDTLQSIASRVYGNPSLWFVLADANGLTGASPLKEGTQLQVPNTVQTGRITDANHVVYDQNEITGSTLPNLKSPEPDGCAIFLAVLLIILIIIVAVVVAVVTFGAGSAISGAIAAAGISGVAATLLTIAATAVVGAAIAFVGALVTQGLLIAFGVQKEVDWKAVAAESAAGAFAGIASGISAAVKVAIAAGKLAALGAKLATAVKVVSVGLSAAAGAGGEALRQVIIDGKVTSWASVAGAAVGAALSTGAVIKTASAGAKAASQAAKLGKTAAEITDTASKAAKVTAARFDVVSAAADIVTEWAKVAEIAVRHEIDASSPAPTWGDYLTAIGGTVAGGISIGIKIRGEPTAFRRGSTAASADPSVPRLSNAIDAGDAAVPSRVPNNAVAQPVAPVPVARVAGQGDAPPVRPLAAAGDGNPPPLPPRRNLQADNAAPVRQPAGQAQQGAVGGGPPPVPPRPRPELLADIRGPAGQRLQGADAAPVRQPAGQAQQLAVAGGPPPVPPRPRPELLADIRGPAGQRLQGADAAPVRQPAGQAQQLAVAGGPPPVPPRPVRPAVGANPANVANVNGANGAAANATPATRLQRAVKGFFKGTEIERSPLREAQRLDPNLTPAARARLQAATLTVGFDGFKAAALESLKGELVGRLTDVGFTFIATGIGAGLAGNASGGIAGLNWIMTGRYGKTNPGQAGRSAVASATSLQLAGNGRQLRLLGSPIDTRTVNTGPRERSLIGVPRAVDPLENFALIAASIGKDRPTLIRA